MEIATIITLQKNSTVINFENFESFKDDLKKLNGRFILRIQTLEDKSSGNQYGYIVNYLIPILREKYRQVNSANLDDSEIGSILVDNSIKIENISTFELKDIREFDKNKSSKTIEVIKTILFEIYNHKI